LPNFIRLFGQSGDLIGAGLINVKKAGGQQ
jgi:hypothetical protein